MSTLTLLFSWFLTMLPGNFHEQCESSATTFQPCGTTIPVEESQSQQDAQEESSGLLHRLWSVRPNGISNGV